jgi:hypothetical protein
MIRRGTTVVAVCCVVLAVAAAVVTAVRVKPHAPFEVVIDGNAVLARVVGDENHHRTITVDENREIVEDAIKPGVWTYVVEEQIRAAREEPSTPTTTLPFRPRKRIPPATPLASGVWTSSTAATGNQSVLAVTVSFADEDLLFGQTEWNRRLFTDEDSLQAFYTFNSYGKLSLTPATETCGLRPSDGVATTKLSAPHPRDSQVLAIVAVGEALWSLGTCVDWQAYDKDGDGWIAEDELHVIVIFAGTEGALGCSRPVCYTTWASTQSFPKGVIGLYV